MLAGILSEKRNADYNFMYNYLLGNVQTLFVDFANGPEFASLKFQIQGKNLNAEVGYHPFIDQYGQVTLELDSPIEQIYEIVLVNQMNTFMSEIKLLSAVNRSFDQFIPKETSEYEKFLQEWTIQGQEFNGQIQNLALFQICKKDDEAELAKSIELADCFIISDAIKFPGNIFMLARSSNVIYSMLQELKQQYSPKYPIDLSKFFEGFSKEHVHMYLCCVYNPHFKFFMLHDIMQILRLAVRLDNQKLIKHIENQENFVVILKQYLILDENQLQHPCYIENILSFAQKHQLHVLSTYCQLFLISRRDQVPESCKDIVDCFNDMCENEYI